MYAAAHHTSEHSKAISYTNARQIHICKFLDIYARLSRPKKRSKIIDTNVNYIIQGFFPYTKGWFAGYEQIELL